MAKTKRSKKSKNQILEEKLRLRIIILFVIFAIIVSALRLGFIGQGIHNCVAFLTGNLYGVVYLALLVVCIYILCKAQIPRLKMCIRDSWKFFSYTIRLSLSSTSF